MEDTRQDRPHVQLISISVTGFGIHAHANGRTGLEAWRTIRKRHPRITLAAAVYGLLLGGLAVATVIRLIA
ncbi:hypothetical protein ACFC09_15700 [Streptomyces sp. NPDC056161]|uniref:hypothetical protein n=1 Tax=Streptomyces sp. NPDC056161 TaxID=3345732 RepID=UPI0035DE1750